MALLPTYNRSALAFDRGEGAILFGVDGKSYLDFAAGMATVGLGYSHPVIVEALKKQADKLWHVSNLYTIPEGIELSKKLVANSIADYAFFCNSGTEAMEATVKMVRKFHHAEGNPHKHRIITFKDAFHGRSISAISASNKTEGFAPALEGFDNLPIGDLAQVEQAINDETAAILIETILGEGGIVVPSDAFLQGLEALCRKHGLLFCLDEIQCGMGRTGKLFAYQHMGLSPDIIMIAKAIGNGFPLGACLATKEAAKGMVAGTHGSTYGGNPLAMAVGNAVMNIIAQPDFLAEIAEKGAYLKQKLEEVQQRFPSLLLEVRGKGLMIGVQCAVAPLELIEPMRALGLLTAPASNQVIRFLPPLIITKAQIDQAVEIFEQACKQKVS